MRTFFYNIGYFILEARRNIHFTPLANLFSVIGTGLILFLFGLVLTGWSIGDEFVSALRGEAMISAYFTDDTDQEAAQLLIETVKTIEGVENAEYIDEAQAYEESKRMLGNEAEILELFEDNPFEAYMVININLDSMDTVLQKVSELKGIEYVRDNRDILEKMKGIVDALKLLGALIAFAVGITTLIIISHMIRQGIYNSREQINTLRLLGAPGAFIGFPFILAGTFLTVLGGGLAALLLTLLLKEGYNRLSAYILFLPMPPMQELLNRAVLVILTLSLGLGLAGSLFGLSSIRKTRN